MSVKIEADVSARGNLYVMVSLLAFTLSIFAIIFFSFTYFSYEHKQEIYEKSSFVVSTDLREMRKLDEAILSGSKKVLVDKKNMPIDMAIKKYLSIVLK